MAAVDFLHQENPPTCAGVEPTNLGYRSHGVELGLDDRNGQLFPAASSLCHTSSTVFRERSGGPDSQQLINRCFRWVTGMETVQARVTIEYFVYREMSEHNVWSCFILLKDGVWQA
ncbi:hypothetical protein TNCV_5381 [Trichonephila clavipes]|nr:hypothetical protein TNCV_5381 [Trichonephila clavipes]